MRKETIEKALAHLPCTRAELASKLDRKEAWASQIAAHLLAQQYAKEWGSQLNSKGVLVPILVATGKIPC